MTARWPVTAHGISTLWAGILIGPCAWALDLLVSYALVQWACAGRRTSALQLITIVALMLVLVGARAAWLGLTRVPRDAREDGGLPADRARFMAMLGLLTSVLFALLIVATAIPRWMLDPCHQ